MQRKTVICSLALMVGLILPGCAVSAIAGANLHQWVSETLQSVEPLPVKQRYHIIIERVASSSSAIPEPLRKAAERSQKQDEPNAKQTLLQAAAPYFSQSCLPDDPTMPASKLLHICFEKKWPHGDFSGMLEHIDSATYLYARALKMEFENAGVYEDNARKLLANLLISNAELRQTD